MLFCLAMLAVNTFSSCLHIKASVLWMACMDENYAGAHCPMYTVQNIISDCWDIVLIKYGFNQFKKI